MWNIFLLIIIRGYRKDDQMELKQDYRVVKVLRIPISSWQKEKKGS